MKTSKITLGLFTALSLSTSLYAENTSELEALRQEVKELREITNSLIDETSDLKNGFEYTTVDTTKSHSGLGSAASKVYYSSSPLSIGGYGEMYYASQAGDSTNQTTLDVYRFVPYIGYKFSDNIILNAEIEFEHGGVDAGTGGEVVLEFMYLDFLLNQHANIRVGHFLMPMGLINERHEPTLFTTVQRPNTAEFIIPSTWNESGVMVYGDIVDGLKYKFAAISALQTDVKGDKWLRGGRGGSFKQTDPNLGYVARVDYTGTNGLLVGVSAYYAPSANTYDSQTTIMDAHLDYKVAGARVYGVYSQATRSNASKIAVDAVEKGNGGFINLSYDVLSLSKSKNSLPIFVQYESITAEEKRADGTSGDRTDTITAGINYFPHEQVVLKLDHALETKGYIDNQITSISMGFIF